MRLFRRSRTRADVLRPVGFPDFDDPTVAADPFPHLAAARQTGGLVHLPGPDAWLVLDDDLVREALRRSDVLATSAYTYVDAVLLGAGPEAHARSRPLVQRLLAPDVVAGLAGAAAEDCRELLVGDVDVVSDVALPVSQRMAARLLGLDLTTVLEALAAAGDLAAQIQALDDLAPASPVWLALQDGGLSDSEARSLVRLLWLASVTTTSRTIAHAARLLLLDESLAASLRADPQLVPRFVDEVLRLHPGETLLDRTATAPVTLGEYNLPIGARLWVSLAAAGRDPRRHEDPDVLSLERRTPGLAFGHGIHRCVGAALARDVVVEAVLAVLAAEPRQVGPPRLSGWRSAQVVDELLVRCP